MADLLGIPNKARRYLMGDSLYRNSLYLLINMAVTAVVGFVFVLICTHLYPQTDVGYATVLVGSLTLAAALSNLGTGRTIVRFLGRSETKAEDLISNITLVGVCALVVGTAMTLFFGAFGLKHASGATYVVFVASVLVLSVKAIFDNAFIASRLSSATLIENSTLSATKLVVPVVLVGAGVLGIFGAQLAGGLVAIVVSVVLLKRLGIDLRTRPTKKSMAGKWSFALGSYTSDLIGGLPQSVLPIIVVSKLGPVDGALWYIASQLINFLLTVSSAINQAMFAEMAHSPGDIMKFIKKAALAMYGLVLPLSVIVFVFAHFILRLFSGNYTNATHVLRLMTVFALVGVANYITGSILSLYKQVLYLTFVNLVNAIVVIVYCLGVAHNLDGIAIGWMFGEVANFVLFVGGGLYILGRTNGRLAMPQ